MDREKTSEVRNDIFRKVGIVQIGQICTSKIVFSKKCHMQTATRQKDEKTHPYYVIYWVTEAELTTPLTIHSITLTV